MLKCCEINWLVDRQIDGLTSSIHKQGLVMKSGQKEYIYRKVTQKKLVKR